MNRSLPIDQQWAVTIGKGGHLVLAEDFPEAFLQGRCPKELLVCYIVLSKFIYIWRGTGLTLRHEVPS